MAQYGHMDHATLVNRGFLLALFAPLVFGIVMPLTE